MISQEREFIEIITDLQENGEMYTDDQFGDCDEHIRGTDEEFLKNYNKLDWVRSNEFMPKNQLFEGKIEPSDIKQGQVGDCYFLSAISALSEYPERIYKIFRGKNKDWNPLIDLFEESVKHGIFCVNIVDNGVMKEFILDNKFVKYTYDTPVFAKGVNQELWGMVIEKAWAKKYGSYSQIAAGQSSQALHDLTGAPGTYIAHSGKDSDYQWTCIKRDLERKYVLVCTANTNDTSNDIVANHAYSILGAYEVYTSESGTEPVRLLKLRNPWGYKEWSGDWSDESSKWDLLASEDKDRLWQDLKVGNDGTFFMTYEDYLANYQGVFMCQIHDDYQYSSISHTQHNNKGAFIKFTIETAGNYHLEVHQEDKRQLPKSSWPTHKYSIIQMVVGQAVGTSYSFKEDVYDYNREVWSNKSTIWTPKEHETYYEPGTYYVYIKAQWRTEEEATWTLSTYGPQAVQLELTDFTKTRKWDFFQAVYIDKARREVQQPLKAFSGDTKYSCTRSGGFICYTFFSTYEQNGLLWKMYLKDVKGYIKLNPPHAEDNHPQILEKEFQMELKPMSSTILLIKYKTWDFDYSPDWDTFKFN